ncbi:MAG: glycosyltransferase family 39 protein [Elusimicrobia bacterium]|nr:glycosyltransferase family 39 protein [Elusimicrobiota bacterium]
MTDRRLWLVLAGALALRLGYGLRAAPPVLYNTDSYVDLARSLAERGALLGEDGRPTAAREPGYPIVLAAFFRLFGASYWILLIVHSCFGVGMIFYLHALARSLHGERTALGAAFLAAVYPPFIYYAAKPLRETFLCFWAVFCLYWLERASRERRPFLFAAAGAAAAAAVLTKATVLPFALILVPAGFLWTLRGTGQRGLRLVAIYLAVFSAIYGLWPLRNWISFNRLILGNTEGGGTNFYIYQVVPQELGGTLEQTKILSLDPGYQGGRDLDDVARDRYFWRQGLKRVRDHPAAFLRLAAWRLFWDEWRLAPRDRGYDIAYRHVFWASLLSDGWIIPLGFLGLIWAFLKPPGSAWVYLFLLSESLVYAMIFTMIRYRLAMMPFFILYASVGLERCLRRLKA